MACTCGGLMLWSHSALRQDHCAFVLGCCRTGRGKGCFYPPQQARMKVEPPPIPLTSHRLHFMAAACDSSRKPLFLCLKRLFAVLVISCCTYFPGWGRSWGGDHLLQLLSGVAGRFSQTMTQSFGVAYLQPLLVRRCVKPHADPGSGTGNTISFPSE